MVSDRTNSEPMQPDRPIKPLEDYGLRLESEIARDIAAKMP